MTTATSDIIDRFGQRWHEHPRAELLHWHLVIAVPAWVDRYHGTSFEQRRRRGAELGQFLAEHGDRILFNDGKPGQTAKAVNALSEAIAIGAYQPGGITVFGLHFDAESTA